MKRFLSSLIILLSSSSLGQTDWTYWGSSHYFQRYSPAAHGFEPLLPGWKPGTTFFSIWGNTVLYWANLPELTI